MNYLEWRAECAKQLVLRDMKIKELAKELGRGYQNIAKILRGDEEKLRPTVEAISEYLGIEPYEQPSRRKKTW